MKKLGILVIGHGTRDPVGQMQMRNLACQTAGCLSPLATELGFLELADPSIEQGIESLAAQGVTQLITVPVLLFRAGHADRDIPEAVNAAAHRLGVEVLHQTPPLEHQPTVLALSAERYKQALGQVQAAGDGSTDSISLAMIARGSSSATAAAAMQTFAQKRCLLTPVRRHFVGFVAAREPNVEQTLESLAGEPSRTLVVQPHLLFEGEVFHSLKDAVARRRGDGRQWLVANPLGASSDQFEDDRLAKVLAGLVEEFLRT